MVLNNVVTVDESTVSFHTPEKKWQSRQWVKNGKPGPSKARVARFKDEAIVLVFFDAKGIYLFELLPQGQNR